MKRERLSRNHQQEGALTKNTYTFPCTQSSCALRAKPYDVRGWDGDGEGFLLALGLGLDFELGLLVGLELALVLELSVWLELGLPWSYA